MIAFHSGNVLERNNFLNNSWVDRNGCNYILSVKSGGGYCISKAFITSIGAPCQLTIIMVFDSQADIVAVPELMSSVFVPWRSPETHRLAETARAFINAGLCEQIACSVAIAVSIIYDVIDRVFFDLSGVQKDCVFTSSGMIELNDECRERVLSGEHVASDCTFICSKKTKQCEDGGLPF